MVEIDETDPLYALWRADLDRRPLPQAVIFDLGGVVLQWEPRRAYERVLAPELVGPFLDQIDFADWNRRHDAGQPYATGEAELIRRFPADEAAIMAYRQHFAETLTGMVPGTAALIAELARNTARLVALTNWSAETFPHAERRFGILRRFQGVLVSGAESLAKPDPAIFGLALSRFDLTAAETVFIDDSPANVAAAESVGLIGLHFTDAATLRNDLEALGLLGPARPPSEPVFHVVQRSTWELAQSSGRYPWSSRGLGYDAEGFVHCAFAAQVQQVIAHYFADLAEADRVVLSVPTDRPDWPIVVEDLGAGPYPHLYAELDPALVSPVDGWFP